MENSRFGPQVRQKACANSHIRPYFVRKNGIWVLGRDNFIFWGIFNSARPDSSVCYANLEFWLPLGPYMLPAYTPAHPWKVWKILNRAQKTPFPLLLTNLQYALPLELVQTSLCYANSEIWQHMKLPTWLKYPPDSTHRGWKLIKFSSAIGLENAKKSF